MDEIAFSIHANGFFRHEPLLVEANGDRYVVIEGNRRLAACKLLTDPELRQAVGATRLPELSPPDVEALRSVPVIVSTKDQLWRFVGYKHVNGPQEWSSYAKARYILDVHQTGVSLEEIANTIGDRHATVKRLYRAIAVLQQAEDAKVWTMEDRIAKRFAFSHLFTGLGRSGIQEFLGLDDADGQGGDEPRLVPANKTARLGQLLKWLYGSRADGTQPLIKTQNPDLGRLDEALKSPNAVAALTRGAELSVAYDVSRGDNTIFREALIEAKINLQTATGAAVTGYQGEATVLELAGDVSHLARNLHRQLQDWKPDDENDDN